MNDAGLRLRYLTGVIVALVSLPLDTFAAAPVYHPVVGHVYDYGIEFRVEEKDSGSRKAIEDRQRCRLRFHVTGADDEGWTADYQTTAFFGVSKPSSKKTYARSVQRSRDELEGQGLSANQRVSTGNVVADRFRAQSKAYSKELARMKVMKVDTYPGLFNYCDGKVRVSKQGEVTQLTGDGNMPFATGHIVQFVLIRIPPNEIAGSFSYRETNKVLLHAGASDGKGVEAKELMISVMTPRDPSAPGLVAFNRDLDHIGGAKAGVELVLSGKGFCEFSNTWGMPHSGSLDYQSKGFSYVGYGDKFAMRLGFHYLNDWRGALFDYGLLPMASALDAENLPRLDSKQQAALRDWWNHSKPGYSTEYTTVTNMCGPPPFDSIAQRAADEVLSQTVEKDPSAKPGQKTNYATSKAAFHERERIDATRRIVKRWENLRRLATLIPRKWSDTSGSFSAIARLSSYQDKVVTIIRSDNGQRLQVPMERLSEKDAEFAKTFGKPTLSLND